MYEALSEAWKLARRKLIIQNRFTWKQNRTNSNKFHFPDQFSPYIYWCLDGKTRTPVWNDTHTYIPVVTVVVGHVFEWRCWCWNGQRCTVIGNAFLKHFCLIRLGTNLSKRVTIPCVQVRFLYFGSNTVFTRLNLIVFLIDIFSHLIGDGYALHIRGRVWVV